MLYVCTDKTKIIEQVVYTSHSHTEIKSEPRQMKPNPDMHQHSSDWPWPTGKPWFQPRFGSISQNSEFTSLSAGSESIRLKFNWIKK